ncbi:hypothetical protein Rleg9DRAFT_5922 [Rhizobium leguminosarum bv. trifolii WSM597]|uniref:Uncharacterized protein n=1 Tax=Rhizobium leguminosarum bv. trifolii WSM597 TaxID=754764 RepID=J0H990_RHILT|nr:hypothetical protein Rleg9DRAFT_5922 [Rhizobium leguminosarum bv. trifolii WSM597]
MAQYCAIRISLRNRTIIARSKGSQMLVVAGEIDGRWRPNEKARRGPPGIVVRYLQIAPARKPRIASPKGGRIIYSASTILLW